jgi:pimeloyl-ACP methyl ester carboxylesterase
VRRGAIVHEPALRGLAGATDAEVAELDRIRELAAADPRRAMEAFLRDRTSAATFETLAPELRERVLGNGANFFARELPVFVEYIPDAASIRAAGVPLRVLVGQDGAPDQIRATTSFARQIELDVRWISGHHAPYLQQPEAFAEELRPILRELA